MEPGIAVYSLEPYQRITYLVALFNPSEPTS